jgi:RNA polymerase sigma-32 factor
MQDSAVIQNQFKQFNGADARAYARSYVLTIKRYYVLERGQDQQFARRWHEHGHRSATDALITSHLRLAEKVARSYRRYGLPLSDLIAEANLGLVIAASRSCSLAFGEK